MSRQLELLDLARTNRTGSGESQPGTPTRMGFYYPTINSIYGTGSKLCSRQLNILVRVLCL
jgi:hypothetical protein